MVYPGGELIMGSIAFTKEAERLHLVTEVMFDEVNGGEGGIRDG